jgi:hypothetical protein
MKKRGDLRVPSFFKREGVSMSNKDLLEENGVDRIYFYQVSTPIVQNAYTVCLLLNKKLQRIESRGIAICSVLDSFNIAKGKQKAFGRAVKALKRKKNYFKINGDGRSSEFTKRSMKIKTMVDDRNFLEHIVPELNSISPEIPIKVFSNDNDKFLKKYIFDLPVSYPIMVANKNFRYKSQYRPAPVGEELPILANMELESTQSCTC